MKTIIIGGGTISPIKEHLALCAPAYGKTARYLHQYIENSELVLTRMAGGGEGSIETTDDLSNYFDALIKDDDVKCIIMTAAVCDFSGEIEGPDASDSVKRLSSSITDYRILLNPFEKIISKIRKERTDIFLVGFKTTVGKDIFQQYKIALKMLKTNKCNLVLANDLGTKNNMVVVPEENFYVGGDRTKTLDILVDMTKSRMKGTYNSTAFIKKRNNIQLNENTTSRTFVEVLRSCINAKAYKLNDNGFTPGHFCFRTGDDSFLSSQRKVNHSDVFENGMTKCTIVKDDIIMAEGTHKPSVGARSQAMLLKAYPDYDCLIHFHTNLVQGDGVKLPFTINERSQFPYQCGSFECGKNTLDGMTDYNGIKAVHLDKHGPNILFKSTQPSKAIIDFIFLYWELQ